MAWAKDETDRALLLINRIAELVLSGDHGTLKGALASAQGSSKTMKAAMSWAKVAGSLREELMTGRNEILASSWKANYEPYVTEAVGLIEGGTVNDGHELLKATLVKWTGKAAARAACCIALRNLTDHAIARHNAARSWQITPADIKTLKGRAPKKRKKAALTDQELELLINGIAERNHRWGNVIKLLALFGLRPIELQHLVPNQKSNGDQGIWCSYEKNCGGALTEQRQLEPCWLKDATAEPIDRDIIEQMHAGTLELPLGNDGQPRKLNGHYVEQHLKRQPEWQQLKQICEERGEWLRSYSFRDSYSLRCHRQKIEVGAICDAMGHNLEAHARAYRWSSASTTSAAFAAAS